LIVLQSGPSEAGREPSDDGLDEAEREPSPMVTRLLKLGPWTAWRLRRPGNRYTLPVQVRAATQVEAETLIRQFFPNGALEPVDVPKRPRGRPPRQRLLPPPSR
jgi:hypothetical protein